MQTRLLKVWGCSWTHQGGWMAAISQGVRGPRRHGCLGYRIFQCAPGRVDDRDEPGRARAVDPGQVLAQPGRVEVLGLGPPQHHPVHACMRRSGDSTQNTYPRLLHSTIMLRLFVAFEAAPAQYVAQSARAAPPMQCLTVHGIAQKTSHVTVLRSCDAKPRAAGWCRERIVQAVLVPLQH